MVNFKVVAREGFLSFALIAAFLTPLLAVELAPAAEGPVMIVTDPFSQQNAMQVIAAAQGNILAGGRWSWIAVGASEDPEFQAKLKVAGALLLLPPLTNTCLRDVALQGT